MVLIWGSKGEAKHLGYVQGRCAKCLTEGMLSVYQTRRRFTVYFIPTFSYSGQTIVACGVCGADWRVTGQEERDVRSAVITQEELAHRIKQLRKETKRQELGPGEAAEPPTGLQGVTPAENRQIGQLQREIAEHLGKPASTISSEEGLQILMSALERRRNHEPKVFLWHWLLAGQYFKAEKYCEALDSATSAVTHAPDDPRGYYALASIFHALGRVRREEWQKYQPDTVRQFEALFASSAIVKACNQMGLPASVARQKASELFSLILEKYGNSLSQEEKTLVKESQKAAQMYIEMSALTPSLPTSERPLKPTAKPRSKPATSKPKPTLRPKRSRKLSP